MFEGCYFSLFNEHLFINKLCLVLFTNICFCTSEKRRYYNTMSSIAKEFDTRDSKKSKIRLSLKMPSLRSRASSSPLERSASTGNEFPERSNLKKIKEEDDKGEASSDSDDSYDSEVEMKKYQQRGGRRRSLSHSNIDDIRSDDESEGDSEETDTTKPRGSSLSSADENNKRPDSPILPKSCLRLQTRRRSTSMSEVEDILHQVQKMHVKKGVHFSPDTVDPPPRECKYREYCERKLGLKAVNAPNIKHEMHKQHMVSLM